jgi:hypothetical protein
MPGNPREMTTMAERRFPVRIRIGVPPSGFGQRHTQMTAWLDENCGSDGWAMTPSGLRGVLNDAMSIYFLDSTLASAFVARWCAGSRLETVAVCSGFATTSRRRGSGRGCIGRLNEEGRFIPQSVPALLPTQVTKYAALPRRAGPPEC